ncbi:8313_t:CDS:1 [Acaulospora morrowiae]|uniref:8313_t:CDS:1 n=1 Tax=Acaulospora morrowiae TaxID=94023 RepID=A0A9N9NGM3_9GLOM|nr:8313_t:CDS:1 [Acaulospora morrowiae]
MEVDLCFVVDCTGSMASHIDATKECIIAVEEYMGKMEPKIKVRLGFIGYRDHCDSKRFECLNFTDSHEEFKDFVAKVVATGGGDTPEDVLGGLNEAITTMTWRNVIRVLLHVCDAPPHGLRFNNLADTYPEGDPNGLTAEDVLENMKSKNIYYFFGRINSLTNEMVRIFKSILGEFDVFDLEEVNDKPEQLTIKFFNATCSAITTAISLRE